MAGVLTNSGIQKILELIDNEINYMGIGTGTAPTVNSITLENEQQRKQTTGYISSKTLIKEGYWDETQANNITFTNAGIFVDEANGNIGTGKLFAGDAINISKNNTQSLTVRFEITVSGV